MYLINASSSKFVFTSVFIFVLNLKEKSCWVCMTDFKKVVSGQFMRSLYLNYDNYFTIKDNGDLRVFTFSYIFRIFYLWVISPEMGYSSKIESKLTNTVSVVFSTYSNWVNIQYLREILPVEKVSKSSCNSKIHIANIVIPCTSCFFELLSNSA